LIVYVRRTVCRTKGKDNRSKGFRYRRSDNRNIGINNWYCERRTSTGKITFVGTPTTEKGVIHGVGKGVLMTTGGREGGEPEMATYTGEGIGRMDSSGSIRWRGSVFSRSPSGGKLSFLNNMIGIFESEIDAAGNFYEKVWEWK
jgi:hypothetical protein